MLGVMKAGAAFIPLDPKEPLERLAPCLLDSAPSVLLVAGESPLRPGTFAGTVMEIHRALEWACSEAEGRATTGVHPDGLASVMYTSGSTGQPKGVEVVHRGILRLVKGQDYAPFGPNETFLHLAPLAFDASTFEIWGALLNGGSLVIVDEPQPSLDAIAAAVSRYHVTTAWFTAGLFDLLVDHRLDALRPLRCILAGGDVLSPAHVRRAYAGLPDCSLVNGYGPTENTTFTCCYSIPRAGWGDGPVPIGIPLSGDRVHILDADLTPVSPGEIGQICCAGNGLARGYLGQPELTATKFVNVWLDGYGQERLYLTGDLGRQRSDGVIEFCGRADFQIKISGKRVELGEIEDALRGDPAIADAIVVAREAPSGGKRLAAYLKLRDQSSASTVGAKTTTILARLHRLLPSHMIPADVVVVDLVPLTANGKVDRSRLPSVPLGPGPVAGRAGPDRRGSEQAIASIWQQVLGFAEVDRDANFFDIGGTSLLLMAIHAKLQVEVAPDLSLMALFEHTSIRSLAAHLGRSGSNAGPQRLPPSAFRVPGPRRAAADRIVP